ncbi:type II toxin-antitoxin system prevent-host-death family antitoxin [Propionimicrobium sp. PCR01-08-3]|uniref:type II toxin-antitoxin system Phd/YefM family antitoxin n=1 Tax=Propionimicrobium sp. PCR01-08-3 TaxID=3052086 RepID=UPI00255CCF79|nr:type II toxin-antitoxin system prevent-host-death family antitoxin [Propionimicrobium sp. PCR01-08-3]WIY81600.1 type II toxin-antitoxin system prevent-host-death family antitoxin [Propionimicrobium sp. PCR01-08-3]
MSLPGDISQRDLRMHSREIMDAVEQGEAFTVTRDGRKIAELIPLRNRRRFVPTGEFLALGHNLGTIDEDDFRESLDDVTDPYQDDPYER